MGPILCHIAVQDGRVKRSSLEVLSHFRKLAATGGLNLAAVLVEQEARKYSAEVAAYGGEKIFVVEHEALARPVNELYVEALAAAAEASGASTLAMASTEVSKDILGALSVRLSASALPDVASVDIVDGYWEVLRPVMAAKRLARTRALHAPTLISVRSGAYAAEESPVDPEVVPLPLEWSEGQWRVEVREIVAATAGQIDLSEARVVVAAGRGVRDEAGAELVRDLASVLGGAVGATRAVVETGMFPATAQIGQTGKVVSPDLYVAVGISGAIQHVAGMSNSRVVVAVNKDPEAPIFKYASYGIVGDLYRILPLLIAELRGALHA